MADEATEKKPIALPAVTADNIGKYISQYVMLRDKVKAIKKAQSEQLEPFNDMLLALNNLLMSHLNTSGGDNIVVKGAGTIYKTTKKSASIEDGAAFQRHVIGTQMFDLLDWKVNAKAVEEFAQEHNGELPPGVKYSTMVTVGVRRDD